MMYIKYWVFPILLIYSLSLRSHGSDAQNTNLPDHSSFLSSLKSYELIAPYRLDDKQTIQDPSTKSKKGHIERTTLVFSGRKYNFVLDITLNKQLFSSKYREDHVLANGTTITAKKVEHCFYHGVLRGNPRAYVSLSSCDGFEGTIITDEQQFFIKPLQSRYGTIMDKHIIFSDDDIIDKTVVTCGHSHEITSTIFNNLVPKHEPNHSKQRVRRNVNSETKYLELFIINDRLQYQKFGDKTGFRAKQLANHLDSIYRPKHMRIALVLIETWKDRDFIVVDRNASKTLSNFEKYKRETLDKRKDLHWDHVQLLTHTDFDGNTVGYAPIKGICGPRSASVIQDHSSNAAVTASTMAHELGHSLGMLHDLANCECPSVTKCIMSAVISSSAIHFSSCSMEKLRETLDDGYGICLFDEPRQLFGPALCGNGFVEEGEQCDCGTQEECDLYKNECCNATTCMLNPGAVCSHGECCDKCQLRSRGYLCREEVGGGCDLPEYCTGEDEMCPEDFYVHDGYACGQGSCYQGVCRDYDKQCQYLFGKDVRDGGSCFNRNAQKDKKLVYSGCYNETAGLHLCAEKDAKCGRLYCLSEELLRPKVGQNRNYYGIRRGSNEICLTPILNTGDGQDLQYVSEGTRCAPNRICKSSVCTPIEEAMPKAFYESCPKNCSGNGVCNNKGHCHCKSGYACPHCTSSGLDSGGSIDSGQGCETVSKKDGVNVAAAVLIPLFLILIIVIGVCIYLKRRQIRERINRYKFVRRTVGRSSTNTERGQQPSRGPFRPTISGPTTSGPTISNHHANQPEEPAKSTKVRRPAPGRPNANAQSTPPISDAGRRPLLPPQSEEPTSLQSVPLYPPSVTPQEPYKPRPSPPRPVPTATAPSTTKSSAIKPKLPPTRQPTTHNSNPELDFAKKPESKIPPAKPSPRTNAPRPKPRVPAGSHRSVPEFPEDIPVVKPREPRPGHQSVPLFNLPDDTGKAKKPVPAKRSRDAPDKPGEQQVDFRAGLKSVPKPWENSKNT